jgi:hypothetical protein
MMVVDYVGMAVAQRPVMVRMTVRLWPLPPFVVMLMMLVMNMAVFVADIPVDMLDLDRVAARPQAGGKDRRRNGQGA